MACYDINNRSENAMDLTVCCIKGCDRASVALGLCSLHYRRTRLYGSPAATKWHSGTARHVSIEERFMERVRKTDSCWTWIGGRDAYGYPMFRANIGGVLFKKGHRASFALFRGPVAEGMHVCHACDNPSCVNPDHLFLGTNKDNMRDKIAKGRAQAPKGEDSPHATLTEEQAQTILLDARPYIVIAAEYGVAASTVGSIKNRVSWRHLSGEPAKAKRIGQRGTACYRATLTDEAVRAIRASSERGKDLAVKFGVSPQTITDIRKQRSWTHVN